MRAVGTSNRFPADSPPQHTDVAGEAIPFWRIQSSRQEVLNQLSSQVQPDILSTIPWRMHEMNHISLVPPEESGVVTDDGTSGHSRVLYTLSRMGSSRWRMLFQSFCSMDKQLLTLLQVSYLQWRPSCCFWFIVIIFCFCILIQILFTRGYGGGCETNSQRGVGHNPWAGIAGCSKFLGVLYWRYRCKTE